MEKSHYDFDFPGAEREFLKAIEVNPNSAYAHLFYSNCYLMPMGHVQEAIAENQKALQLDPQRRMRLRHLSPEEQKRSGNGMSTYCVVRKGRMARFGQAEWPWATPWRATKTRLLNG